MRFNPNQKNDIEYQYPELLESYDKSCYNWSPDMDDKILRITKSSVGTFDFCPKQYYFQNILGLRGEERDYHVRGSNVHDAVEWFWKQAPEIMPEVENFITDGNTELAKKELRKAMPVPPSPYIYGEKAQMNQYSDWQFERLMHMRQNARDWLPIGNEVEVHATRVVVASDGTEVAIHMKGFIDRIFIDADHTGIILMELKTGKWVEKGGRKRSSMRAEMQFYRMMLEHSPHIEYLPVVGWGWQFPGGGINGGDGPMWDYESVKGPGGRYAPKTVENRLRRVVDAHLNDDFPAEAHERKCEYCDFMEMCPAWMGDLAIDPEDMR
tara:strand:+ start:14808 stop:15779 length:972 start_codon:yes stop_codon:yes gene_type:complete